MGDQTHGMEKGKVGTKKLKIDLGTTKKKLEGVLITKERRKRGKRRSRETEKA